LGSFTEPLGSFTKTFRFFCQTFWFFYLTPLVVCWAELHSRWWLDINAGGFTAGFYEIKTLCLFGINILNIYGHCRIAPRMFCKQRQ
jgi:hypothetical protein